jgi:ribosomal-protein-alanine N-acetyltransferase
MATVQDQMPPTASGGDSEDGSLKIRRARQGDLRTIAEIELRSFSNPWHADTFHSLLKRPRARIFVAEDPVTGVVGYTVLWWVLDQGELANLAVTEDRQGRGIGSMLLDHTIDQAMKVGVKSLFLEVRMSNRRARRLYATRGFTQISVRRGYYQNPPEDARVLVKHLGIGVPNEGG